MEAYKDSVKKWLLAFFSYFSGYYLLIFAVLFFVALFWGYKKSFDIELPETVSLEADQQLNAFGEIIGSNYAFELPNGETISIPEGGFESKLLEAFKNTEEGIGENYILDRIYFQTGSASVNDNSKDQVDTVAKILMAYKDLKVLLRGHTDNVGNESANQKLSVARAQALKDQLVERGVAETSIQVTGYGSDDPIEDNSTVKGRLLNRRIDISILD